MSHPPEGIHPHRMSNGDFLFSRTRPETEAGQEEKETVISLDRLRQAYPELLTDNGLVDAARQKLMAFDRFGALVIRIDDLNYLMAPDDLMLDLVRTVDTICGKHDGIWGILEHGLTGCFFPEKDEKQCTLIAESIKKELAGTHKETLTAGIAIFPTISYQKGHILKNALKALDHAEFLGPDACVAFDSISLNISGDKCYQEGDIDEAVAEFERALQLDPKNINVHNSLGVCLGMKGKLDRALAQFELAIGFAPDEVMAIYNAGYVHFLKKEFDKALQYLLRSRKIDPDLFEPAIQTGRVLLEMNRPEKAKKFLAHAAGLNPGSGAAFRLLGDCCVLLDQPAEAVAAYNTALKINPEDAAALSALGFYYEMQNQNADIALLFCRQATEILPDNGLFHHRLGRLYLNRKEYEPAMAEFTRAADLGHDSAEYVKKTYTLMAKAQ